MAHVNRQTTTSEAAASHPFDWRLNQLLREHGFDDFAEAQCATFYAETMGRPGPPPGISPRSPLPERCEYFRLLLIGYFEGIDSERGIAWRAADVVVRAGAEEVRGGEATPHHCSGINRVATYSRGRQT